MNAVARSLVVVLALALLVGMGTHYDTHDDEQWPYPQSDELAADYDQYVGQQTFLFGTVESVDPGSDRATVVVGDGADAVELTVTNFDAEVRRGGVVQVLGTIRPGHTLDAQRVAVVNPTGSSTLFKYAVSLVGAALVVALFFRYWRIDLRTLSIEVRTDG